MPAYDYRCQACGNRFEAWQKITDDPIQVCPKCSGHVQRIIHATGIVFKGGGFYSTDHRGSTAATAVADESHTPAADGAKSEAKAEKADASAPKAETKADAAPATASAPAANAS
jgi:putative FmdB family regulatory protein